MAPVACAKSENLRSPSCGVISTSVGRSRSRCARTFWPTRMPSIWADTSSGELMSLRFSSGLPMSTAITTSAPMFRAICTGRFATRPPSTSMRPSISIGANNPGAAMLPRIACGSEPWSSTTSWPVRRSVATARNGMGNWSNVRFPANRDVQSCSRIRKRLPCTNPVGSFTLPSPKPADNPIGYSKSSSRSDCDIPDRSLRSNAMLVRSTRSSFAIRSLALYPLA